MRVSILITSAPYSANRRPSLDADAADAEVEHADAGERSAAGAACAAPSAPARFAGVPRETPASSPAPAAGAPRLGPWRTPSTSTKPDAKGPLTPGATGSSTKVLRARRCTLFSTSSGRSTGVHTMPRRCASSETSSMLMLAKCAS